jgi:hypothetical protein
VDTNGKPRPHKPYFWPALFLSAFVAAAVLWVVWMYVLVQKTRRQQQNGFFVPYTGPTVSNAPNAAPTNVPPTPTNPANGSK